MLGGYTQVYRDDHVNLYSIIAQYFMTVGSLVVNSALIYFVVTGTRKDIGNYRILLTCFAINDLIYTTIHFLTYPIPEIYSSTLIMRSHGTSFPLLSAHFIYRALTLRWSQFSLHFSKFILFTLAITLLVASSWFFLGYVCFAADDASRAITQPLMRGEEWSPIVHSAETEELYHVMGTYGASPSGIPLRYIGGAAILSVMMMTTYGSILASSCVIVSHVRNNATSASSMRLQKQLFKCLVYQTIFPLVTACFPAVFCTVAPIMGFSFPAVSIIIPNFCALHPLFDGAVVMLTVTEYRRSLIRHLFCSGNDILHETFKLVYISAVLVLTAEAAQAYSASSYCIGVVLSVLLLYCVVRSTNYNLGAYKYMQRIIAQNSVIAVISLGPLSNSAFVISAFLSLYSLTFLINDFNFLYRLWAIKAPERVSRFSNKRFLILLLAAALFEYILWFCVCYYLFATSEHGRQNIQTIAFEKFGIDSVEQEMIMGDYFHEDGSRNIRASCGILILCSLIAFCFGFMIYASIHIVHYLQNANLTSKATLALQRQLFITLSAQTIIPFALLYFPCGIVIVAPFFRIDAELIADISPLLNSLFLPADALAVLYLMKDYRRIVVKLMTCGRSTITVVQPSHITPDLTTAF